MTAILKGTDNNCANPVIFFAHQNSDGHLVDLASLEFEVRDETNASSPEVVQGRAAVDLTACADGGNRLGVGRYVPVFTVPATKGGRDLVIEWWWTSTVGGAERTTRQAFEVLSAPASLAFGRYTSVADLRDQGIPKGTSDATISRAIMLAGAYIERVTGRFFEPRYHVFRLRGTQARKLLLGHPIVAVESIGVDSAPSSQGDIPVELDNVKIYNRHLTQGLLNPDDRQNPMIEFIHSRDLFSMGAVSRFAPLDGISLRSLAFPEGVQNIEVAGVFGYTDPDGSPLGGTPELIRHAANMLALRELGPILGSGCRDATRDRWRVTEERIRDQTIKYEAPRKFGSQITGDPDVDMLLTMYTRPPNMGAV